MSTVPDPSTAKAGATLLDPLFDDLAECEEMLDRGDTQFARRVFVRASFAYLEGLVYWLKGVAAGWLLDKADEGHDPEMTAILALDDFSYRPNENGELKPEPNRVPFLNLCALALRTAAKCRGVDPNPFFSDKGWRQLKNALKVRHRITHPKRSEDLTISDGEMNAVREGQEWFADRLYGSTFGITVTEVPRDGA